MHQLLTRANSLPQIPNLVINEPAEVGKILLSPRTKFLYLLVALSLKRAWAAKESGLYSRKCNINFGPTK